MEEWGSSAAFILDTIPMENYQLRLMVSIWTTDVFIERLQMFPYSLADCTRVETESTLKS